MIAEQAETHFLNTLEDFAITRRPVWHFDIEQGKSVLCGQLEVASLTPFGCDELQPALGAAGALLQYAAQTQGTSLRHIRTVRVENASEYIGLDAATRRNLELTETLRGAASPTLFSLLDDCSTTMGSRLLRYWLHHPQRNFSAAQTRQTAIASYLASDLSYLHTIRKNLQTIADIERITTRLALLTARPRDIAGLRASFQAFSGLLGLLQPLQMIFPSELLSEIGDGLRQLPPEALELLIQVIAENPAVTLRDGGVIAQGYDAELDELRDISENCGKFLIDLEIRERQRTGITTLRVEYNRVHGFFIEVSNGQSNKVPADYQRRQTLKNAERYITPELKAFEDKALSAKERALAREKELYTRFLEALLPYIEAFQKAAQALAQLDVLATLAHKAHTLGWTAPQWSDTTRIEITAGKHPVVDAQVEHFIANDALLDDKRRLLLITGPNMGGKSTFMRQIALITLLAYVGSYVPAKSAKIGQIDHIFTRIGAADDLAGGRSTFMVEMTEAASILHHATHNSLVLMDEIGRGTSTFDGLALAWAIAQHLLTQNGSLTLFSTHYFELTRLPEAFPNAANIHLTAVEHGDQIVFLHTVKPGAASQSYGLQVAKLAGVPSAVINEARRHLKRLEQKNRQPAAPETALPQQDLFE